MLLALFSDFWTLPWPTGAPPPVIVQQDMGSGGGKDKYFPQYPERLDDEYWEAREAFLRRHLPKPESEEKSEEQTAPEIEPVIARRRVIIDDVLQARVTPNQMVNLDREMRELQMKLLQREDELEDEALELLLLA